MIIHCEKCGTKFEINEGAVKETGSKVRCSVCKNIFTAYPPSEGESPEKEDTDIFDKDEFEATVSMDLQRMLEEDSDEEEIEDFEEAEPYDMGSYGEDTVHLDSGFFEEAEDLKEDEIEAEDITFQDEDKLEEPGPPSVGREKGGRPSLFRGVMLLLLLLIAGCVVVYFLAPGLIPDSLKNLMPPMQEVQQENDLGVKRLSFRSVSGSFVNSEKAGQLFVIRGIVKNNYPHSRRGILIKGSLLDQRGATVKKAVAYAGTSLKSEQLRTMSLEEIDKRQDKGKKMRISPNGALPFTIVLGNLPDNLSEFEVKAISSYKAK